MKLVYSKNLDDPILEEPIVKNSVFNEITQAAWYEEDKKGRLFVLGFNISPEEFDLGIATLHIFDKSRILHLKRPINVYDGLISEKILKAIMDNLENKDIFPKYLEELGFVDK